MDAINLMLVDDHQLFLEGVKGMLERVPGFEIKATATDGEEALMKLRSYYIDVLLLDVQMPGMNGVEIAREVHQRHPDTKVIALSMHNENVFIHRMYENGAQGYLLKTCSKPELLEAIRTVYQGGKYFSPDTTLALLRKDTGRERNSIVEERLSDREKQILLLIAKEASNPEIAEKLHISVHTVNSHRKNLLFKLGVKNTAGLVRYAMMKNMLDRPTG